MSREIKFRAWDTIRGYMWNDVQDVGSQPLYAPFDCFEDLLESSRFIMMQFTGLKDKNGREIYEGDKVRYESTLGTVSEGTVEFHEGMFVFMKSTPTYDLPLGWSSIEVIGNIHETPELL